MKLSVKSDYATRAVLGLARRYASDAPCRVEDLAAEQGVPAKYLVQILLELKSKRIARSVRGKDGGYALARPPREITFGDVLRAVEGVTLDAPALRDPRCPAELRRVWQELAAAIAAATERTNFEALVEAAAERDRMYHI
jgi:Rrf2 family protein